MKIIYIISRAISSDGPINQALNILTGLNRIPEVSAVLVTLSPELEKKSWLQKFRDNGIKIYQLNQPSYNIFKCAALLNNYIYDNKVDIVHSSGYRADLVNMLICQPVKKISTQRSNPREVSEELPRFLRPIMNKLHLSVIKRLDSQVACSKSLQKIFKDEEDWDIDYVQNAVNTDFFRPLSKSDKNRMRCELGFPIDVIIYLVLGVLLPRKNNKVIINAFNNAKLSNAKLVIVGGGQEDAYLKELAGSNRDIVFAGVTKTPLRYLQAADILISSSLAEGLPNTVLEALSCGLPVLLSDINPHKELIESTDAGVIFDKNSDIELSELLVRSTTWNLNEKSKTARSIAEEKFSINVLANNYLNVYKNLLK